jgi:hypothetical protein
MSRHFAPNAGQTIAFGSAATVFIALKASLAVAACALPSGTTPGSCPYSGSGPALTITDSASSTATPSPSAFKGIATGAGGHAVTGAATGKNGIGGFFQAQAPSSATTSTAALEAVNSGGSTSAEGNYGSAGVFNITNAKNQSAGVSITTKGINSQALTVVNSGTIDYNVEYIPPNQGPADFGGVAGYFEINTPTSTDHANQSAIFAVNASGAASPNTYGAAGIFEITNPDNNSAALQATSTNTSVNATAMYASVPGSGVGVWGEADGSGGQGLHGQANQGYGVYGFSASGHSGYFWSGLGGNNHCSYDGSTSGWSCNAALAMMDDRTAPNYGELLDRLDGMPMAYFHTKGAKVPVRELAPSAEDFRAAFGLGPDDTTIAEGNAYGVALAAAKGLYQKLKADEAEVAALKKENAKIAALERELAEQKVAMAEMKAVISHLALGANGMKQASLTDH